MTNLKIRVTKQILEESKYCKPEQYLFNCAIALAVRDIFPRATVGADFIRLFNDDIIEVKQIELPIIAKNFIRVFDTCEYKKRTLLDPIEFEISIPDEVIEEINIEELKPLLQNHPTLELIEN